MRFLFFWRGRGQQYFNKIFTAEPNVLAFPISFLTSPLLFFLFVFLFACLFWPVYLLSGAGRTRHQRAAGDGEQISSWTLKSVWLRNDSLSQRWAATGGGWNLASAKSESGAEAKGQSGRGGGAADPITPIRTRLPRQAHSAPHPPSTPHTNTPAPPPSILLCLRV